MREDTPYRVVFVTTVVLKEFCIQEEKSKGFFHPKLTIILGTRIPIHPFLMLIPPLWLSVHTQPLMPTNAKVTCPRGDIIQASKK